MHCYTSDVHTAAYLLQGHTALHFKRYPWTADWTAGILFISCCVSVDTIGAHIPTSRRSKSMLCVMNCDSWVYHVDARWALCSTHPQRHYARHAPICKMQLAQCSMRHDAMYWQHNQLQNGAARIEGAALLTSCSSASGCCTW